MEEKRKVRRREGRKGETRKERRVRRGKGGLEEEGVGDEEERE